MSGYGTSDGSRVPSWMFYVNYARKVLLAFRGRCGLDDPWARDEWHIPGLPVDDVAIGRLRNLDWRPIRPAWLRELSKRWARHRLRAGISTSHVNGVRLAVVRLIEFCELQGWPIDDPSCLTRELFDAFLDHVRFLEASAKQKHRIAYGVKQLLEESHDLGWISLRHPRVYLRGELPTQRQWLPRALPAEVMVRLNEPRSLEQLTVGERAAVLVLMDCGLRATDTARLKIDAVISGSDGAPYLRYWNHKRRREAVVPLSDRAARGDRRASERGYASATRTANGCSRGCTPTAGASSRWATRSSSRRCAAGPRRSICATSTANRPARARTRSATPTRPGWSTTTSICSRCRACSITTRLR